MNLIPLVAVGAALLSNAPTDIQTVQQRKELTISEAKPLFTPAIVKDCAARLKEAAPGYKFYGGFSVAVRKSNNSVAMIERMIDPEETVALVIASRNKTYLGVTYKGYTACSYHVRSRKLVFNKILGPNFFPRRYKLMPGEE
ncbi:MAG: hypothetical protein ACTHM2_06440 [Afipia sp.]